MVLTDGENTAPPEPLEIAQLANEALDVRIREGLQRERALSEQVTFYQKVIAPELSEDGFSIDGVQVTATASENYYSLSMVLIRRVRPVPLCQLC